MKKSTFVEGTIIATLAIVFTKILGMVYVIPFYAMVGGKGSALYAYAYNIYNIFLDISAVGLPIAISKIINEYNTLGMMDAKVRTYKLGKRIMAIIAIAIFLILMIFAPQISSLLLGNLKGGNTVADVSFAIRCVSFAILIVPFLSVEKGYLQGHKIINVSSISQILEQIVRIAVILLGTYIVLNILNKSVTLAVGISVLGAFVGGIVAYLYIKFCVSRNKKDLGLDKEYKKDSVTNKEIIRKIFKYAIPFIIINIVSSCYNFVDMTLILRTMNHLGLSAKDVEFVTSAVATWAPKINMIVTALAMGMSTSFIPTMVSAYTKKDWKEVNNKYNQAFQMILLISLPMTIGISMLSKEVWSIFYGPSNYGSYILALNVFTGLFINIYMIASSALQGLNKFKTVYIATITGFVTNAVLDVPLMLLYSKIGIPPFLGAVTSSIIGYVLSIIIIFISLKKDCDLKYKAIFETLKDLLIPVLSMILVVLLLSYVIPINLESKLSCTLYVGIIAILGGLTYIFIAFKLKIIDKIFGKENTNRVLRKISFGKINRK